MIFGILDTLGRDSYENYAKQEQKMETKRQQEMVRQSLTKAFGDINAGRTRSAENLLLELERM